MFVNVDMVTDEFDAIACVYYLNIYICVVNNIKFLLQKVRLLLVPTLLFYLWAVIVPPKKILKPSFLDQQNPRAVCGRGVILRRLPVNL